MILDIAEDLIIQTKEKINILIGGTGDKNDDYFQKCEEKINYLKNKYPHCFWSNPYEFFFDGLKVNLGSDFGLMPSLFEPGGIVQHEFFIAGTPVIAFKTGGLQDTVFEFNHENWQGNGFIFDNYYKEELKEAINRAINLFYCKDKYYKCRENAYNSAIDVMDTAKAWCKEFYRLRNKIYYDKKAIFDNGEYEYCSADQLNFELENMILL
jgi:starch synthase